jgi:DNA-directed RNA polymerase subunit RPC12/RpoP
VNESSWQVEHQCPQCGAPVILDETYRILSCPYCRTKLYIEPGDHFRYCIPSHAPSEEAVFLPYWRFKGLCFSFQGFEANHRFLDANLRALVLDGIPESLGLRPQAMNLKFASPEIQGRFIDPRLSIHDIMAKITEGNVAGGSCHRFIGKIASLIYSPFYLKNDILYDAVTNRPSVNLKTPMEMLLKQTGETDAWKVRFISTLCPQCGWDLEGDKDAIVLLCRNCNSAWRCNGTQLEELPFTVMEHPNAVFFLPFWRLKAHIEGIVLASVADLIRTANLPKAVTPVLEQKPFYFWLPAFKVNPLLFLRTARQMTVVQPEGSSTAEFAGRQYHPVNLSQSEAVEGIAIVIADLVTDKRQFLPILKEAKAVLEEGLLVYHPFIMNRNELVHAQTGMAIDRNALAFGAVL